MAKKKPAKKGGHNNNNGKGKNGGKNPGTNTAAEKPSSVSSVDPDFTEVKRRKRLPRACKKADMTEEHFRSCGLQVRKINGDGNCLFRAFSDQLTGLEKDHLTYRKAIVEHLVQNKDDYSGFHEQEEEASFDERLKKLAKAGSYGGQDCVVAFARIYNRVVYVHQPDENITLQFPPRQNDNVQKYKQVHILYTGGNHYDSIRLLDDSSRTAPADVHLTVDAVGAQRYSLDKRSEVAEVRSAKSEVVRPAVVFLDVDETVDGGAMDLDADENVDPEQDSALGSDGTASISSSASGASESEHGDAAPPATPPEVVTETAPFEVPLSQPEQPFPPVEITSSHSAGVMEIVDLPSELHGTDSPRVSSVECEPPVEPAAAVGRADASRTTSTTHSKPLSKHQKRLAKKQQKNGAVPSAATTTKGPDPVQQLTQSLSKIQITAPSPSRLVMV
ncbi:putative OTU domain-containing protein 3 [Hypsibius exemplaris]|uniref:OTU domain-containing protein 3 n=1 Tax=Hypsibius exemplaris TaxID=2072580 RepID=A0A1W0WU90_HYPEX|nr:putative OTU domain-containing protein 3 [Hypsibius exemplaris]